MLPIRLEVCNFLAYLNPAPINFEGLHLACLSGPNGAGKSALLDAITWALWKRARANQDDKLLRIGQEEMFVIFEFQQDRTRYRVWRTYSKRKRGQSTLDLAVWDGQAYRSISEASIAETQRKINGILRLDYDTFVNSAFVQQGHADSFTASTPGKRKELLAEILGLARWQDYETQARERLRAVESELSAIQVSIEDKEREEAREPEVRRALDAAGSEADSLRAELGIAEASLAEVAEAPAWLQAARDQQAAAARRIQELRQDLEAIAAEQQEGMRRRAAYRRLIADRERIEAGYAQLEATRALEEELAEKRDRLAAIDSALSGHRRHIEREHAQLEAEARSLDERIQEAMREAESYDSLQEELTRTHAELDELEALRAEREALQGAQKAIAEETGALSAQNRALKNEMNDLRRRLDMLESAQEARCPVCNGPLDDAQRADLAEQYESQGKECRRLFDANQERLHACAQEKADTEARIAALDKALRAEAKLKAAEGRLVERLEKAHAAGQRAAEDRAALAEVQRLLAEAAFATEARAALVAGEEEAARLGYDRDAHAAARESLKALRGFERQQRDLEVALEALPGIESALAHADARQAQRADQLAEAQRAEAESAAHIADLEAQVAEARRRRAEVERLRALEREAGERLVALRQQLLAIEAARRRKDELLARRDMLREELVLYTELRDAFGKNGVPAMIIEAAIPELEIQTNELLARMTDGRMHIRFDTQRARKSGDGVIETLDILIGDELGTRDYDMFSGGEGFRINFALRVALSQFLARRAGARLQTLVIDEGFGSQDNVGRERLVEAISAIREEFDLILIVTHIDELREAFPAHIEIRKGVSGSEISVR